MVIEEARENDPVALTVLEEVVDWLGIALANCINLLGPDMLVIGGSVGRAAGDLLLAPLQKALRKRTLSTTMRHVEIVTGTLGPDAAASALLATITHAIRLHAP